MANKQQILIAHSDEDLTTLMEMMLEEDFDFSVVSRGREAIKALQANTFDIVMLDTALPDIDGLQICLWVKDNFKDTKLPVIFLSHDSDEEMIRAAYANGAYDYLCLPLNIVSFHEHILRFADDLEALRVLEQRDKAGSTIAETAMKQASFYGQGLELVSALNSAHDEVAMAQLVGKAFDGLSIPCAMQFRDGSHFITLGADGQQAGEVEVQIFELLKSQGRIYNFGRRCIFNDEHVSLLVKIMPKEGTSSYDAVIDMVAKFVPALEARLLVIHQHHSMEQTKSTLLEIMQVVNSSLDAIQLEKISMIENIEREISLSFGELDLQEYQEKAIVKMIEKEFRGKLQSDSMLKLRDKVEACIKNVELQQSSKPSTNSPNTANTEDIELF